MKTPNFSARNFIILLVSVAVIWSCAQRTADSISGPGDNIVIDDTIIDIPSDTIVDTGNDTIIDIPSDTIVDTGNDTIIDVPSDTIIDTDNDTIIDIPSDTITDPGNDTIIDIPSDTIVDPDNDINFAFAVAPTSGSVAAGSAATTVATVTPQNGFTGSVAFSLVSPPSGVTLSGGSANVTGTSAVNSNLSVAVAAGTAAGSHNLTIRATSGTLVRNVTFALTITPSPNVEVETPFRINAAAPRFMEATVHDPSVIRVNGRWWVFGSHLQSAHSDDLIRWTQHSAGVDNNNPVVPNVLNEFREALEWANSTTLWAGDVIRLRSTGAFHFYYSACEGTSPRSALGLATAATVGGPYTHRQILLRSGMWNEPSPDGRIYNPNVHPNAIDPHVFYDAEGNLWMVYGSFSGGIFILELDPQTGLIRPNQGYGTRLTGGNHARIEGAYILYSPESNYYYLFLTFGGLSADGGYNVRIARSRTPNGPYFDPQGNNMLNCRAPAGSFFDDVSISPYGGKMIGNFRFTVSNIGYVSPGHNSAYYDNNSGKYYIFFHTRFPSRGEVHNLRVHQMHLNSQDWLVIAPHRYAGETVQSYSDGEIAGNYQLVIFQRDISAQIRESIPVHFAVNGTITGETTGRWQRTDGNKATITIGSSNYYGVFTHNWDAGLRRYVVAFSGMSNEGLTILASQITQ